MQFSKSLALAALAVSLVLAGCSSAPQKSAKLDPFAGIGSPYYEGGGKVPLGGGRRQIGKPYQVAGRWFHPREMSSYDKTGMASWYGPQFHRRKTSNGEWFDMNQLTAAHATMPLPSYVKVTNLANGNEVVLRVNDRGPFVDTRVLDVSRRAAEVLDFKNQGKTNVRVQLIGPAPLNDKGTHLAAMNRELRRGTPLRKMIARAGGNPETETALAVVEAPEPPTPAGNYYVQVGSFADQGNAERTREELANVGPVEIESLDGSNGTIYRVRLGPLADEGKAEVALQEAVDAGHPDARLVVASSAI